MAYACDSAVSPFRGEYKGWPELIPPEVAAPMVRSVAGTRSLALGLAGLDGNKTLYLPLGMTLTGQDLHPANWTHGVRGAAAALPRCPRRR